MGKNDRYDREYIMCAIESIRMIDEIIRGCTDKSFELDMYCIASLRFAATCIEEKICEVLADKEK